MVRCRFGVRSSPSSRLTAIIALAAVSCTNQDATPQRPSVVAQSQPLWTNGGFESDAVGAVPSSWTVTPNLSVNNVGVTLQTPQTLAGLNLQPGGTAAVRVVGGAVTEGQTDANAPVAYPKFGQRTAVVNYVPPGLGGPPVPGDQRNVNTLTQQMTIAMGDVDPDDSQVHVRFALAPVLGNTNHPQNQQPYYFVQLRNVTQDKVLYTDIEFSNQPGVPWITSGSVVYTNWQLVDVAPGSANLALGDAVELRVIAAGCSQSGHPGHVYVDGFGTTLPGLYAGASASAAANAGSDLTYTIRYKNGAAAGVNNAIIDFATPPNTTFQALTSSGTCTQPAVGASGTVSCNVGSVAAAASGSLQITVRVDPSASGQITAGDYTIRADGVSRLLGSHVVTAITNPDLAVSVSSGLAGVGWGQPITYTVVVSNTGTGPAPAATLTDTMPAQLTNVSWTCSAANGGVCAASGSGDIDDTTLVLPAAASATYLVHGTIIAGTGNSSTLHSATAAITSGGGDSNSANNTGSELTPIGPVHTLTLTKTAAGTIGSAPGGISCGPGCTSTSGPFLEGTSVTLTAIAPVMGQLQSWGGACASAGMASTCMLTLSADQSVSVSFSAPASTVAVSAGDAQKTRVSTAFGVDLDVLVSNAFGDPVAGASVAFAAPGSGAAATFSSASALTDSGGHAHVTATANSTAGAYSVSASVAGVASPASFALTNLGSPASVSVVSGSGQALVVGSAASDPLVVEVRDSANQLLPGVTVDFSAPNGGATSSLSATSAVTDSAGRASTSVTASNVSGGYSVTASVAGVASPATFTLTNTPSSATVISVSAGDAQQAVVGSAFSAALDVRVTDEFGNIVPNVAVSFSVPSSGAGATLSAYALTTDASGHAVSQAAANSRAGSYAVSVTATGASAPVAFNLTNLAGAAASIALASADSRQSAQVNSAFVSPLAVSVTDAFGNPVMGASVMFVAPGTGASAALSDTSVQTDSAGRASVTANANATPGNYTVSALLAGNLGQVDFTLTNTAGSLPAISTVAGSGASAAVGSAFATPLEVLVTLDGTPLANAAVTFTAPSSGPTASLTSTNVLTDVHGHAQVVATAGTLAGGYTVSAVVANGIRPASFALTNRAGAPARLVASAGSTPQTAQVNNPFASQLAVDVLDAHGNAVSGVSVTFTAPSSGASAALSGTTANTDANGRAQVSAVANGSIGSYTVSAAVGGVGAPALLQLQNVGSAPLSLIVLDGSPQSAVVNRAFASNLRVQVTGANSTPIPNALVSFSVPDSGASAVLSTGTALTNGSGIAELSATAGQTSGSYEVLASVDGALAGARFSLSNTPGPAAAISADAAATPQSARITTAYAKPLRVRVVDSFGNGVAGAHVAFTAPSSEPSATLSGSAPSSDSSGAASVVAIASQSAGSFTVTAAVSGTSLMTMFMLTNTAGDPVNVQLVDGIDQSGVATQPFASPVKILVRDALGNPVAGGKVHVSLSDGDRYATLSASELTTNDAGEASVSVTAKDVPGQFTISFSVDAGAMPALSTFTVTSIPTRTRLELDPTTVAVGAAANVTVTVASDYGTPAGHVEIFVDGVSAAKLNLTSGTITWTLEGSDPGKHEVTALYEAQDAFGESHADALQLSVEEPGTSDAGPEADGGGKPESDGGVPPPVPQHVGWKLRGGGCSVGAPVERPSGSYALFALAFAYLVLRRRRG
jgi:uncharacterized repeat protein (TIGR01451 family)